MQEGSRLWEAEGMKTAIRARVAADSLMTLYLMFMVLLSVGRSTSFDCILDVPLCGKAKCLP